MHPALRALTLTLGLVATSASAATLNNTFGLAAPTATLAFDGAAVAPYTTVTNQFASQGVTFSQDVIFDGQGPNAGWPGVTGDYLSNFNGNGLATHTFSIFFNATQTEAAFGFATNPTTTTFTALLNGLAVESFTIPTTYYQYATAFVGFTNSLFNQIEISVGGTDGSAVIDNIQMSAVSAVAPVPLPGTLGLAGAALGLLALLARRRPKAGLALQSA